MPNLSLPVVATICLLVVLVAFGAGVWATKARPGSNRLFTRQQLQRGMRRLGQLAQEENLAVRIQVFGGSAMVLAFNARPRTRDLDVVIQGNANDRERVMALAAQVAAEFKWPVDWLNDEVATRIWGTSHGQQVFTAPGIVASIASIQQLLANKLCAFRDMQDQNDAEVLLQRLRRETQIQTHQQAWEAIWGHILKGDEVWARRNLIIVWNEVTHEEVPDDSQTFRS